MSWKETWKTLWAKYRPEDNPGSKERYSFAIMTRFNNKVLGRQFTYNEIHSTSKLDLTVNELLDLKFQNPDLIVRSLGTDNLPEDYPILRAFFNAQDVEEFERFGRPDSHDNIGIKVTSLPMDVIEKVHEKVMEHPGSASHDTHLMDPETFEESMNSFHNRKE